MIKNEYKILRSAVLDTHTKGKFVFNNVFTCQEVSDSKPYEVDEVQISSLEFIRHRRLDSVALVRNEKDPQ